MKQKNDIFTFQLKFILYIYLSFCLFPLIDLESTKRNLANERYISAIFTGSGKMAIISSSSSITPTVAYMTSSWEPLTFLESYECSVSINNNLGSNNITLDFQNNDFYLTSLFKGLSHITKVDLTHYKRKPKDTSNMFSNCQNLEEVIIGNFDTSNVLSMSGMFQNTKVTYLNLDKFNTNKVEDMTNMFDNCVSLTYLDLKNFNFSLIKKGKASKMLNGCNSLKYLNIYSLRDGDNFDYGFFDSAKDLIYCINEKIAPNISKLLKEKEFTKNCSIFNIEEDIVFSSDILTEVNTADIIPKTKINSFNCSSKDLFSHNCEEINNNKTLSIEDKDNLITNLMNDIIGRNLDTLLEEVIEKEKKDLTISKDDITLQVTSTENQNNNEYTNISTIYLGNCETILKNIYKIPHNLPLIILKVDYIMEELKFPVIGYEIFSPLNKTKLNLAYCNNETVNYNIPIIINEKDLDKYNTSSDYYNDECTVFTTDDGTDIIILDRKKEFNEKNLSLCENGCNYTN